MRLFVAIPLEDEAKQQIAQLQKELKKSRTKMRLVEKDNLHITVRFFGEADEKPIIEAMKKMEMPGFGTVLDEVGAFPSKQRVRVIWVGNSEEKVIKIHDFLQHEMGLQKQEFKPHATLARVKSEPDEVVMRVLEKEVSVPIRVSRVVLMKSELTPEGPKYEEVFKVALD